MITEIKFDLNIEKQGRYIIAITKNDRAIYAGEFDDLTALAVLKAIDRGILNPETDKKYSIKELK